MKNHYFAISNTESDMADHIIGMVIIRVKDGDTVDENEVRDMILNNTPFDPDSDAISWVEMEEAEALALAERKNKEAEDEDGDTVASLASMGIADASQGVCPVCAAETLIRVDDDDPARTMLAKLMTNEHMMHFKVCDRHQREVDDGTIYVINDAHATTPRRYAPVDMLGAPRDMAHKAFGVDADAPILRRGVVLLSGDDYSRFKLRMNTLAIIESVGIFTTEIVSDGYEEAGNLLRKGVANAVQAALEETDVNDKLTLAVMRSPDDDDFPESHVVTSDVKFH